MAHMHGKGGDVYIKGHVLEDCEDAWDEYVDGDVTESLDNSDYKVGAGSAKFVCAAGLGAGDILATEAIAGSYDLSIYEAISFWVKTDVAWDASDMQLLLDDTANCASPTLSANIPAIGADTWTKVLLTDSLASVTDASSIGLKQIVDKGAMTVRIDDVVALYSIAGIASWSLDYQAEAIEVTDFNDAGVKSFIAGQTQWSGTFEGFKDGAPLTIGDYYELALMESSTSTQAWVGRAVITGVSVNTDTKGAVSYSYTFQGTGELAVASA